MFLILKLKIFLMCDYLAKLRLKTENSRKKYNKIVVCGKI
jgi:hypothetical protein